MYLVRKYCALTIKCIFKKMFYLQTLPSGYVQQNYMIQKEQV